MDKSSLCCAAQGSCVICTVGPPSSIVDRFPLALCTQDTLYFLFLLLMIYVGFALALYVQSPPTVPPGTLALKLFTIMVGDVTSVRVG